MGEANNDNRFLHRKLINFDGNEKEANIFLEDLMANGRLNARTYRDVFNERRVARELCDNVEEKEKYDRLYQYFKDEE